MYTSVEPYIYNYYNSLVSNGDATIGRVRRNRTKTVNRITELGQLPLSQKLRRK